jgi:hypothetical protein
MGHRGLVDGLIVPVLAILSLVALALLMTHLISKWVVVGVLLALAAANAIGLRQRLRSKSRPEDS